MDISQFKKEYDTRYQQGYMESWPAHQKKRTLNYLRRLKLPRDGNALDFGCGKGDFTILIKEAYPNWNVYGTDISDVALELATETILTCSFYSVEKIKSLNIRFDFVLSHHVFEHVPDLGQAFGELDLLTNENATMLHILPARCDNTIEHWVAASTQDGIDDQVGGRYFYEHPGHLRRMSADDFSREIGPYGFSMVSSEFANKIFGTLDWISATSPALVGTMFDHRGTTGWVKKSAFMGLHLLFGIFTWLRFPSNNLRKAYTKRTKGKRKYLLFLTMLVTYPVSFIVDKSIVGLSILEWNLYRKSGSEMYLILRKG